MVDLRGNTEAVGIVGRAMGELQLAQLGATRTRPIEPELSSHGEPVGCREYVSTGGAGALTAWEVIE